MAEGEEARQELDEGALAESRGHGGFVAGLIFGAILGAGLSLLFAPQPGNETRRALRRRLRSVQGGARRRFDRLEDEARRELRRRRKQLRQRLR